VELDQLRTFLAVIEHAGFTRAAEALGLSQSTVSFQIKSLEADAGARLLDRGPGGVVPTPAGRVLRRHAERVLEVIAEAKAALSAESEGAHGHVIVAASTIPGEYLLPPVLALLRRTHPGVSITIDVGDSGSAIAALLAGRCDLALVGTRPADRRIATRPFADDEVVLVGAPGADGVDATDPDVLRTVSLVLRKETSGTRAAVATCSLAIRRRARASSWAAPRPPSDVPRRGSASRSCRAAPWPTSWRTGGSPSSRCVGCRCAGASGSPRRGASRHRLRLPRSSSCSRAKAIQARTEVAPAIALATSLGDLPKRGRGRRQLAQSDRDRESTLPSCVRAP
jgi:DNA-binding transcriptional LysR family regulator